MIASKRASIDALALRCAAGAVTGLIVSLVLAYTVYGGAGRMLGLNLAIGAILGLFSPSVRPSRASALAVALLTGFGAALTVVSLRVASIQLSDVYPFLSLGGTLLTTIPVCALARGGATMERSPD